MERPREAMAHFLSARTLCEQALAEVEAAREANDKRSPYTVEVELRGAVRWLQGNADAIARNLDYVPTPETRPQQNPYDSSLGKVWD